MSKIEPLTEAQKALFPEYVKRWTDIGSSTLPADRGAAEEAIVKMYAAAGLPAPKKIASPAFVSPLACCVWLPPPERLLI